MLATFLKLENWTVFTAGDGVEALKQLEEVKIDFIISDIYMPNMDGLKLHARVRELTDYKRTPYLFVSGYGDQFTLGALPMTRNDGFIQKTKPLTLLKRWIQYLMIPEDKRPSTPPIEKPLPTQYERTRDMSAHRRR